MTDALRAILADIDALKARVVEAVQAIEDGVPGTTAQCGAIITACAEVFHVTPQAILKHTRYGPATDARLVAMWICAMRGVGARQIANQFRRHRSGVASALRRVEDLRATSAKFSALLNACEQRANNL